MITLSNLTKTYGLMPVLRGVSLEVGDGECVGLVGANGAGKSTLLRIVATLQKANSGTATVGGWPLPTHADKVRAHIGYISHQSLLYDELSAEENLQLFAKLYNLPDAETVVDMALKEVGLSVRRREPVKTFSRGMVQRLAIARATLHAPDLLLLDEPYTGLDQQATALLDSLLLREKEKGRTIMLVTHDLTHGLSLCDRILILHRGKIVSKINSSQITADELVKRYREATNG